MKPQVPLRFFVTCFLILTIFCWPMQAQFLPGEGGAIQFISSTPESGKFAGLFIRSNDRAYHHFSSGTYSNTQLAFPEAATIGAESFTLQYLDANNQWQTFRVLDVDYITAGNNFTVPISTPTNFRLLANGGSINGYTSNVVFAVPSLVDTRFAGWGFDESVWISGIMLPWVGRGLQANFTVRKMPEETEVVGALAYQWYRVNPVNFEKTAIANANALTYITTRDDIGYLIMLTATGDGVSVGGSINLWTNLPIMDHNNAFADQISLSGFRLNLYKKVDSIPLNEIVLRDNNWNIVPVRGVQKLDNGSRFYITADMEREKSPYSVSNTSRFWRIASVFEFPGGQMAHESINIDVATVGLTSPAIKSSIFPVPASQVLHFQSPNSVRKIEIIDLNGRSIMQLTPNSNQGTVPLDRIPSGVYSIRFVCHHSVETQRFQVIK